MNEELYNLKTGLRQKNDWVILADYLNSRSDYICVIIHDLGEIGKESQVRTKTLLK